jgi:superfamily II DNA or RNA helicase
MVDSTNATLTPHQAKYFAYELKRSYANDHVGKIAGLLFDAQVEPKPHQIDAALFALQTPFLPGVILADEVGLGKTIEAGIVVTQYWAERRRRILIVAPSSLRQQWKQELFEKFLIPASILDPNSRAALLGAQGRNAQVLICSYEFVLRNEPALLREWDLVIADEAHRLRNHWSGKGKIAEAVSHVVAGSHKSLFLTATPLQNRLEELFGLVSVFDPNYFYSLEAFRERYVKGVNLDNGDDLADRVATISKRTLRRDAEKYIHFTKRMPITVEFAPSPEEQRLYSLVNEYLQRETLYAFSGSQRHLSALIIRKRLGSSTFAVASTLSNIANRLEGEVEDLIANRSYHGVTPDEFGSEDLTDEEREAFETIGTGEGVTPKVVDSGANDKSWLEAAMRAEVAELRGFAELASSITTNQKAVKLVEALEMGFSRLRELGAPEKSIIFTDSTKTQQFIARALDDAGWGEGIVLFNGSNDSPEQTTIYRAWLEANAGSDLITGVVPADRRKALVDYFRDQGRIMIATEAASEGINLQFCSMLVNYDLPWNPQRVEQRIGRIHRFGQQFDVVVANFSNKGNLAEQRILELLETKFQLFSSVFGASDEVLGAIEDGFDFERRIADILSTSRSDAEIERAFAHLEAEFAHEISAEMANARARVFDNLDPNVQDRLKSYDAESGEVLNKFERLLLAITKMQLGACATFDGDGRQFVLHSSPVEDAPTGRYFFKSNPQANAHQYRYSSSLGQHVVNAAAASETPEVELVFSLGESERVATGARALLDKAGALTVRHVTFAMKARDEDVTESYILAAAVTDDGGLLDDEDVADLMELRCTGEVGITAPLDHAQFDAPLKSMRLEIEREVQSRNARYYDQQEELIYRNQQDRKAEHEGRIREFKSKEKEARRQVKQTDDPMEQLKLKREAQRWERRVEEADDEFRELRKKLREESDKFLDLIEQALKGTQSEEHLFTVRWRVEA